MHVLAIAKDFDGGSMSGLYRKFIESVLDNNKDIVVEVLKYTGIDSFLRTLIEWPEMLKLKDTNNDWKDFKIKIADIASNIAFCFECNRTWSANDNIQASQGRDKWKKYALLKITQLGEVSEISVKRLDHGEDCFDSLRTIQ